MRYFCNIRFKHRPAALFFNLIITLALIIPFFSLYDLKPIVAADMAVSSIFAVDSQSYAIREDGSLWTWFNSESIAYPTGLTGVKSMAFASGQNYILKEDGTIEVYTNFNNHQDNPGRNLTSYKRLLIGDVESIAGGERQLLALKKDGTVWSLGDNSDGRLGYAADTYVQDPRQIPGLAQIKAIAASGSINLALTEDGQVWSWGYNEKLPLSAANSPTALPHLVAGLANVQAISVGEDHNLALLQDGTVRAWGANENNQLGTGDSVSLSEPVQVPGLNNIAQIFAGVNDNYALTRSGDVMAWGRMDPSQEPAVISAINHVRTLSVAPHFTLVLAEANRVSIYMQNSTREISVGPVAPQILSSNLSTMNYGTADNLRDGIRTAFILKMDMALDPSSVNIANIRLLDGGGMPIPIKVSLSASSAREINIVPLMNLNLGVSYQLLAADLCGVTGRVMEEDYTKTYTLDLRPDHPWEALRAGAGNSFYLRFGEVLSWGDGQNGQIGDGENLSRYTPSHTYNLQPTEDLAVGALHEVALDLQGHVLSWGDNSQGQLGDGTYDPHSLPALISGLDQVVDVEAGSLHSLALKKDGTVWAWGDNSSGQLGSGSTEGEPVPVQVKNLSGIIRISANGNNNLALKYDGTVWAWGDNTYGQLGAGHTDPQTAPVQVQGLNNIANISAGLAHSLALKYDGTVWAWGLNEDGELGNGQRQDQTTPVQVQNLSSVKEISAGYFSNIALTNDGAAYVWGDNYYSQLGNTTDADFSAVPLKIMTGIKEIAAGGFHVLALKGTDEILGWGLNNYGQVGNGTITHVAEPAPVAMDPLAFRIAGQNRRETAYNVAFSGWNYGADTVVLTREDNYPDALAGTPLAYALNAPILLTDPEELSPDTEAALTEFRTRNIIILGSEKAISADIENNLKQKYTVLRISGEDRYETSAAIARYMRQLDAVQPGKAILVNGLNFPDALAVSSPAAYNRIPILLTDPQDLPEITEQTIKDLNVEDTMIIGGTNAVSAQVEAKVPNPTRIQGADRYETAVKLIGAMHMDLNMVYLATGQNFPDALAGSVLAARTNSPVILVDNQLTPPVISYLNGRIRITQGVYLLGGKSVVPDTLIEQISQVIFP